MTNVPDWLAALGIVAPSLTSLGGGLTGYWLAGRNEDARDRRMAEREAEARRIALAESLDDRKHTFQLELLLELQNVLQHQVRATTKLNLQDQRTLREQGALGRLPPEIDQDFRDTSVEFRRLQVRVLDDGLRDELNALHSFISGLIVSFVDLVTLPPDQAMDRLERQMSELNQRYEAVNETLGALLRAELGRTPELPTPGPAGTRALNESPPTA